MSWSRGKALGGSSKINFMIATRGNPTDYDKWAEMGNIGWSYKELLPLFMRSETSYINRSDTEYRGKDGLLSISDVQYRPEISKYFLKAGLEAGYKNVDYNGKDQMGVIHT